MLGKLHLTVAHPDQELFRTVLELTAEAIETRVASDATSRNTLTKLQTVLLKAVHDSATAERGGEETVLEETAVATPARARRGGGVQGDRQEEEGQAEGEEDEVTMQLRREMQETRIEDGEGDDDGDAESTRIAAIGDETVGGATSDGIDVSQLPDEKEMQSLMDSIGDDEDEDLVD